MLINELLLEAGKLNMSKATVVKLASGDAGVELQGEVFGIRNDNPIVAFMLEAMGVPMDGLAIKIRSGFMQYDERSKMLFIARYKSDLPNKRSIKEARVVVPFNNYKQELGNLEKAGIKLSKPGKGGGDNDEVTLTGDEKAIRKYLAKLWNLNADSEEIDELFE